MRSTVLFLAVAALVAAVTAVALTRGPSPEAGTASSHREAPAIAEDPSADPTDLYAFRSLDAPDKLTIIANWLPAEDPSPARTGTASPTRLGTTSRSTAAATASLT